MDFFKKAGKAVSTGVNVANAAGQGLQDKTGFHYSDAAKKAGQGVKTIATVTPVGGLVDDMAGQGTLDAIVNDVVSGTNEHLDNIKNSSTALGQNMEQGNVLESAKCAGSVGMSAASIAPTPAGVALGVVKLAGKVGQHQVANKISGQ
jgi:hypothetical protein